MCSVVGCYSERRSAQRFKLPEDPERRLEWVQFLAAANKQRFKESSWTDITICSEHFKDDSFDSLTPSLSGVTDSLVLKPSAVPSLSVQSDSDEPEPNVESPNCPEPVETAESVHQCYLLKKYNGPTSNYEEPGLTSTAAAVSGVILCSADTSDAFVSEPKRLSMELIKEKAALLKMKGKYVVREKLLLQLFSYKCPSCGSKLKMEKYTYGVLVIFNQQCLQCEYRNQWKSQVNASVPAAGDQLLIGGTEVTLETQQVAPTDDSQSSFTGVPEIVAVIDEESDTMLESSDQGDMDSDEDWEPRKGFQQTRVLHQKGLDDETKDEEDEKDYDYPPLAPKRSQLCTECGMFFSNWKPHTCEHKVKPYSCNICGKRCVSEVALNAHSRIHDEDYEYRCKYCHVTFKTKVAKMTHQQAHLTQGKPYKCSDCSEMFATNKERKIHLENHRGPKQLKCHICGMDFLWPLCLQRHLAVHTGLKPYKCSVCHRGFNQPGHLKSHMRLHTGERPYKCQHCDKRFNHNVSLKSHVRRYHSTNSSCEQEKEKRHQSDTGEDSRNKKWSDSGLHDIDEAEDTEEEVLEIINRPKKKSKSTGRPIGRPKSYKSDNTELKVQVEDQRSKTKTVKQHVQKLMGSQCSDEDSKDELCDSAISFDSAEEEEGRSKRERSRGRPKNSDSDSDFDPEDRKKKRCSSQNSVKNLGKRKGRPRKTLVM